MNPDNYQANISAALGVSAARAAEIAAEYPLTAYPFPWVAFSTLVGDASFACPALQIDQETSQRVPTYAYEFNDDTAPPIFTGPLLPPPVATHESELQYLFDLPNAHFPIPLNPGQQALAASMQAPGHTSPPPATPRPRPCPGPPSARAARRCCRSSRRNHNSKPTLPPGTTVRSGPPGNR